MQASTLRHAVLTAAAAAGLALAAPAHANAQVSFGVNIGSAPVCPYGYYGYAPYNCAPYGYYGPEWFTNGIFIGAGPWFHGHPGFYGHVNHDFDPRYGYHGPFPGHNEHFDPHHNFNDFHGNDFHGAYGEGHHEGFHGGHPPR
jgi:hypothetical protein